MSKEAQPDSTNAASADQEAAPGQADITYHKPPSFLWFVIPLALLLAYGYFSR